MADLSRRAFLSGTVVSVAAAGVLIKATDGDMIKFANQDLVNVVKPEPGEFIMSGAMTEDWYGVHVGQYLYNQQGMLVGLVDEIHPAPRNMINVESHDSSSVEFLQGVRRGLRATLTVLGPHYMPPEKRRR